MNQILNIILGRWFGISGIIFASLLSAIVSGLIWQCSIIFKIYFKRVTGQFYRRLAVYGGICIICCLLSAVLSNAVLNGTVLGNLLNDNNSNHLASYKLLHGMHSVGKVDGIPVILDLFIRGIICTLVAVGLQLFLYSHLPFTKKELARAKSFIKRT